MSTTMAFLSGKGGSGKTTLALSMADMLCRCGIDTLLVDCDMSTNGATYFYEVQLNEWNGNNLTKISSFHDALNGKGNLNFCPLKLQSHLDFIPSVSGISEEHFASLKEINIEMGCHLDDFISLVKQQYDVVLFDCQAGFSEFLPALLPQMDADLFVLEADNISASAMRSLHLKIGNHFGRARLYQVFNKATREEFEIYSKIVGTFFTNIGTLLFDWTIRQAFSRSQVPDFENTSEQYGKDLCNVCKIIFRDNSTQKKLAGFSANIQYQKLKKELDQNELELKQLQTKIRIKRNKSYKLFLPILFCILTILELFFLIYIDKFQSKLISDVNVFFTVITACFPIIVIIPFLWLFFKKNELQEKRTAQLECEKYKQRIVEIEEELLRSKEELTKQVTSNNEPHSDSVTPKS